MIFFPVTFSPSTGINFALSVHIGGVALENYFKEWLHDVGTDTEHLHIIMPGDEGM